MTLRQIVFHIGRHKSGTSSLQLYLMAQRRALSSRGILYPQPAQPGQIAHHALAQAVNPLESDGSALEGLVQAISAELQPHHHSLLLSSEAFQNVTEMERLTAFVARLGAPEVRIIAYVREHLDYAVSAFRQLVQNQPVFETFGDFATGFTKARHFILRWQDLGDLTLKWYDRTELRQGDIIADFCHWLDLPVGEVPRGDRNPSIGGNLLVYKLAANWMKEPALHYDRMRELALEHRPFRTGFHISDEAAARLRENSAYNESFADILGEPPLRSFADLPPLPDDRLIRADLERMLPDAAPDLRADLADVMEDSAAWFTLPR